MSNIQAFLSPRAQKLTLAYSSQKQETISISIRDSFGQAVYSEEVEMENGVNLMHIQDVKALTPGLYTLELQKADTLFYTQKLIKN